MKVKDLFDEKGNIKGESFDPFRELDTDPRCKLLFDEDGDLLVDAHLDITQMITDNKNIDIWSDAVALIYAHSFAMNTKGNYSAIYYWR